MLLGEKMQILRSLEGNLRGFKRPLSKSETVRLIHEELGESISQAYLSQLETGRRPHMTEKTRELLSRFFKVHPGFFVSDPEGFDRTLATIQVSEEQLDDWVSRGADRFARQDPEISAALRILVQHEATRELFLLMAEVAGNPDVIRRFRTALRKEPSAKDGHAGQRKNERRMAR
jgi:hypothetical protein